MLRETLLLMCSYGSMACCVPGAALHVVCLSSFCLRKLVCFFASTLQLCCAGYTVVHSLLMHSQ